MAGEPGYMAENENLNNSSDSNTEEDTELRQFWGFSRMLMLGMLQRFHYNYKRYQPDGPESAELPGVLLERLHYQAYVFHNRLISEEATLTESGSRLVIGQKIYNLLYQIHHQLLDYDASEIAGLIPQLDRQLAFWSPDEDPPRFLNADSETATQYIQELYELDLQD